MQTRSIGLMPCSRMAAACSGLSRRASRPPWILGGSVFTRPSIISGKPVTSATSVTGSLFSRRNFAVPPVLINSMPNSWCSARAKSSRPVLSETDNSARRTGTRSDISGARVKARAAIAIGASSQPEARMDLSLEPRKNPAVNGHADHDHDDHDGNHLAHFGHAAAGFEQEPQAVIPRCQDQLRAEQRAPRKGKALP